MKFKSLMTWSPKEKKARLFRVIWEHSIDSHWDWYSACFSLALMPKLFQWKRGFYDYRLVILGISLHYMRSYSGRFV